MSRTTVFYKGKLKAHITYIAFKKQLLHKQHSTSQETLLWPRNSRSKAYVFGNPCQNPRYASEESFELYSILGSDWPTTKQKVLRHGNRFAARVRRRYIAKFRDRASWSRETVQPMKRRAFVFQNIDQVLKIFCEHCYFVFLLTDASSTRLGSHYFEENIR